MIFALLLFGNALYEQEELENGWFKRVRRAVTRPFKEVKRAIHHTSTSYEKPPITIGSVTSKKRKIHLLSQLVLHRWNKPQQNSKNTDLQETISL